MAAGDRARLDSPGNMRDRKTIDAELRLLATVRRSVREHGIEPSSRQADELLERLAQTAAEPGIFSGASCQD
jgi:hypothetical protein